MVLSCGRDLPVSPQIECGNNAKNFSVVTMAPPQWFWYIYCISKKTKQKSLFSYLLNAREPVLLYIHRDITKVDKK